MLDAETIEKCYLEIDALEKKRCEDEIKRECEELKYYFRRENSATRRLKCTGAIELSTNQKSFEVQVGVRSEKYNPIREYGLINIEYSDIPISYQRILDQESFYELHTYFTEQKLLTNSISPRKKLKFPI